LADDGPVADAALREMVGGGSAAEVAVALSVMARIAEIRLEAMLPRVLGDRTSPGALSEYAYTLGKTMPLHKLIEDFPPTELVLAQAKVLAEVVVRPEAGEARLTARSGLRRLCDYCQGAAGLLDEVVRDVDRALRENYSFLDFIRAGRVGGKAEALFDLQKRYGDKAVEHLRETQRRLRTATRDVETLLMALPPEPVSR
jgi:hypothetical protein